MKRAFTIIELLIVMSLIGTIMLILLPDIKKIKGRRELEISAREVSVSLNLIRRKAWAISSQTEFLGENNGYTIRTVSPVSNSILTISSGKLPKGVIFDSPATFKFGVSGFPLPGYSGTAVLRGIKDTTIKIIVSSFGRIRIE